MSAAAMRVNLGRIRLRGLTVSPAFEAALRTELARLFEASGLDEASGRLRLPHLQVAVEPGASETVIAATLARSILEASLAALGREQGGAR